MQSVDQHLRLRLGRSLLNGFPIVNYGIEACREIQRAAPEVKIIMLTSYGDDDTVFESINAGASGFVVKQIGTSDLIKKIEDVGAGNAAA